MYGSVIVYIYLLLFTNEGDEVDVVLLMPTVPLEDAEVTGARFASVAKVVEGLFDVFRTKWLIHDITAAALYKGQ